MLQKRRAFRSQKYLNWVKTLPCVICRASADDAHHIIGIGGLSGMGMKAPDQYTMPVCREHHSEIHKTPELWDNQWMWIAHTLAKAFEEKIHVSS
jgi:hypothetical protein